MQSKQQIKASKPTVKRNRKKKQPKKKPMKRIIQQEMQLGVCCEQYAMALVDPWCLISGLVGIPAELPLPSYKFSVRARGILTIGSEGTGYVSVNPFAPFNDQGSTSGIFAPVHVTTANYSGLDYRFSLPSYGLVTGVVPQWPDSPFSLAQFQEVPDKPGANLRVRTVGAGVKISYAGSEFKRSGRAIAYRSPMNLPIIGTTVTSTPVVTQSDLLRNKETATVPVDRKWHSAVYKPATPTDLSYGEADDISIPIGNYPRRMVAGPSLLVFITGSTPGESFEFDYLGHFEAIGSSLPGFTTTTPDLVGMGAVSAANSTAQPSTDVETNKKTFLQSINEHLDNMTHIVNKVSPLVHGVGQAVGGISVASNVIRTLGTG